MKFFELNILLTLGNNQPEVYKENITNGDINMLPNTILMSKFIDCKK